MVFTKEITRREKSAVTLTITMANSDVRDVYNAELKDVAKNIQLKGFRKGKVPRDIIEAKFKDALREQALNEIVSKSVTEALEAEDFPQDALPLPYSDPQLEGDPALDLAADFRFSVVYDVFPLVNLTRYEGFEVEADTASVTEADVARELERIRDLNAIMLDREDGAQAADGDVAAVDYRELDAGGAPLADGMADANMPVTLGQHAISLDFDDDITGMKKNEEKIIEKSYPEDCKNPALAGKTKRFKIKLLSIKEKKLPSLDDELAQDIDEKFKTLDDLKTSIRKKMEDALEQQLQKNKSDLIIQKIIEENPVEVPDSMMKIERFTRLQMMHRLDGEDGGLADSDLLRLRELAADESLMSAFFPNLRKEVCARLIVNELKKTLNVEVSDDEIEKQYDYLSESKGIDRQNLVDFYTEDPKHLGALKGTIKSRKVIELLLEKNKALPGKQVTYLDIMSGAE